VAAGKFVGRVGGLAVVLGVGFAAYQGTAVAWADAGSPDTASAEREVGSKQRSGPARVTARDVRPADRPAARVSRPGAAATVAGAGRQLRVRPPEPDVDITAAVPQAAAAPAVPADVLPTHRKPQAAVIGGGQSISVAPTVVWDEGILAGTLNATTASGDPLSYVGITDPSRGGKLGSGPLLPLTNFGPGGSFSYIPYASALTDASQTETFRIMALENSKPVQFVEDLLGPLGALLIPQVLAIIHRIPLVGDLLSPIIGQAKIVEFTVAPGELAEGRPTAFTYKMPSFDGTLISVNYFPAVDVATGVVADAPTVLAASGLACAANTDPQTVYGQLFPALQFGSLTPGIAPLREGAFSSPLPGGPSYDGGGGYNVITWDPRGEFASEGQLQIDNPFFEGRDVSSIISWLTSATNPARAQVKTESGDPLVGMTGGSYGGGIQLTTIDDRIDAITPEIAWNSLLTSLYPNGAFKTGWGTLLALALAVTGARINPVIYEGILTGALFGRPTETAQALLGSVGPTTLLSKEQTPTLLFQGIHDTLFPLSQSVTNGQTIQTSPADPPLKMFWFCGGHGVCDIPNKPVEQDARGLIQNLQWLDQYVAKSGTPADAIPTFQWYDQKGLYNFSDRLPWDPAFNQGSYTAEGKGGFLGLLPLIGGSGPITDLPLSIIDAGKARNAVNVAVTPPAGKQVVGSPKISFTYTGLGISDTVYAQLVDNTTGLVLSNVVTPIPVKLDGRTRTVTMSMEDIAYSIDAGDSLTLQITGFAFNYADPWTFGGINISDIVLDLPLHDRDS
jgi:ABC-2 type transport system ATP-binding protein